MKKVELTKEMRVIVREDIHKIIDGDQLEKCFDAIIRQYFRQSQFQDGELLTKIKNSLFNLPDIYIWKDD